MPSSNFFIMFQKQVQKVFGTVERHLLAQRLFWGRLLCGAKSKELDLADARDSDSF
jgi:hypothetical protein